MTVTSDGSTGLALAEFHPTQAGCKASYSLTVTLPKSCADVRAGMLGGMGGDTALSDAVMMLNGPGSLRVFLTQSSDACTVTKTETLD